MAPQGNVTPSGFWDLDGNAPAWPRRVLRASAVAVIWVLSAVPVALGWQRCPVAALLHRPCPGCGMTRAIKLLVTGHLGASLHMHPLALPVLVSGSLFALATVGSTLVAGSPLQVHRSRLGRFAIALSGTVYGATLVLWGLRAFGMFGGPVPV